MPSALSHAPTLCFLMGSSLSRSKPRPTLPPPPMAATSARIAVVGDVHNDWYLEEDTKALQLLQPDLVLFTGDFGEENVELVQSVANLEFPKAVILGNHDAWYTQQFSGKKKDGVQRQLER
ncbi:Calcineurin-like phosphoesterase domain, apaH type [Trema orientale]|uniref:Calcineurin-like phosphoesterase domain, apaH type n=1 Tax=Trema orientale TaxID=63057 RepID=A0A2P5ETF0_TREOI|nr:Calcineurin-like phosphoesterase domain, apaH type [Trema orientale]